MFFYSAQSRALRRSSIAPQGSEARLTRQIAEVIAKQSVSSAVIRNEQGRKENDQRNDSSNQQRNLTIRSSSLASTPCYSDIQINRKSNKYSYRRPTVTIQDDGRFILDHITSRWDGIPLTSQSALLEAEDGATVITDTMKEDETRESTNCSKRTGKERFKLIL
ncbi:Uncoordinated protein [Dirofilaria immitis]